MTQSHRRCSIQTNLDSHVARVRNTALTPSVAGQPKNATETATVHKKATATSASSEHRANRKSLSLSARRQAPSAKVTPGTDQINCKCWFSFLHPLHRFHVNLVRCTTSDKITFRFFHAVFGNSLPECDNCFSLLQINLFFFPVSFRKKNIFFPVTLRKISIRLKPKSPMENNTSHAGFCLMQIF